MRQKYVLTGVIQTAENSVATLSKITDLKASIENKWIFLMGKRSKQKLLVKQPDISATVFLCLMSIRGCFEG